MQRFSFKFAIALLTFIIGVAAVTVWYLRRAEPAEQQPAVNVAPDTATNNPETTASSDPCGYPIPNNKRITAEEAVILAECFIIQNGYTDLPPMEDRSRLTPESVDPGTDERGMEMRHDSLERRAYGFMQGDIHGDGWTIAFRYRRSPDRVRYYGDRLDVLGRAVTMDAYGRRMRVQHSDLFLTLPYLQKVNR
jgi:hypothetical protein